MRCSSGSSASAVSNEYGFANFPLPRLSETNEGEPNRCCFTNADSLFDISSADRCMTFDVAVQDYPFAFSDQLPPAFPSTKNRDIAHVACGAPAFFVGFSRLLSRIHEGIGWTNPDAPNRHNRAPFSNGLSTDLNSSSVEMEHTRSGYWLWGVTFDDSPCAALYKFSSSVRGVSVDGLVVVHRGFYGGRGYRHGNVSGDYVSYGTSGLPVQIKSKCAVSSISLYATLAWEVVDTAELILEASSESGRRLMFPYLLDWKAPSLIQLELPPGPWKKIRLRSDAYHQVVFDNLQFLLNCDL